MRIALRKRFGSPCHDIRHKQHDIRHIYIHFLPNMVKWCISLILPCEVAVKSVVPAVKALLAQELVTEHGLKQDRVAEILGISQSAVSKYSKRVRGHVISVETIEGVQPLIDGMVGLLVNGTYERSEFLRLFCQACMVVRRTGVMCDFCRKSSPKFQIEECSFCIDLGEGGK